MHLGTFPMGFECLPLLGYQWAPDTETNKQVKSSIPTKTIEKIKTHSYLETIIIVKKKKMLPCETFLSCLVILAAGSGQKQPRS